LDNQWAHRSVTTTRTAPINPAPHMRTLSPQGLHLTSKHRSIDSSSVRTPSSKVTLLGCPSVGAGGGHHVMGRGWHRRKRTESDYMRQSCRIHGFLREHQAGWQCRQLVLGASPEIPNFQVFLRLHVPEPLAFSQHNS
jgi:hypothetical protein